LHGVISGEGSWFITNSLAIGGTAAEGKRKLSLPTCMVVYAVGQNETKSMRAGGNIRFYVFSGISETAVRICPGGEYIFP
jgi:hypothetical protein